MKEIAEAYELSSWAADKETCLFAMLMVLPNYMTQAHRCGDVNKAAQMCKDYIDAHWED